MSLEENGVALSQPINFGEGITYGYEGIATLFPAKFWNINLSVSLYQQNINGRIVNTDLVNNVLSWYSKLINNFTIWKGSKLQIISNYNSPVALPQGQRIAVYNADLGFQQKLFKGQGAIGLVVLDIFNIRKNGENLSTSSFSSSRTFNPDFNKGLH